MKEWEANISVIYVNYITVISCSTCSIPNPSFDILDPDCADWDYQTLGTRHQDVLKIALKEDNGGRYTKRKNIWCLQPRQLNNVTTLLLECTLSITVKRSVNSCEG